MKQEILINADDGGVSLGVNTAIKKMIIDGNLNAVSIFTNGKYTHDIIDFCKNNVVNSGLHFNLTTGNSIAGHKLLPSITKPNGEFKYGFFVLSILVLLRRKTVLREIELELTAQIEYLQTCGINLKHINGHRHIHIIPNIFKIVKRHANINKIGYIRSINESFFHTLIATKNLSCLWNGNLIKWGILRAFGFCNGSEKSRIYFFSILHTCKITNDMMTNVRIPKGFSGMEIMLHPGNSTIDKNDKTLQYEIEHLTHVNRDLEASFKALK